MIIAFDQLHTLAGQVGMVDGGFDPLHRGHIEYFRSAAQLGVPVLCNLSSDAYVGTKHAVFLPEDQRAAIIDAIRYIDYTHVNRYDTETVIRELRPRYYFKGADWRDRLPAEQMDVCRVYGVDIVYLNTVLESSSRILRDYTFSQQNH